MAHAFESLRLFSLFALLAILTTIGVTKASAETGAYWEIGLTKVVKGFPYEVNASTDKSITLLTKVGLSKVEINCTATSLSFNSLEGFGGFTGRVHYWNCTTKLNGSAAAKCLPHSSGAFSGLIETNLLDGLLRLHTGGVSLFELLPWAGPLVTLELGSECAIGNKIEITGKVFIKDAQGEGSVNKVEHLIEEGPLSSLLFGANAATIDGSAFVFLRGEYSGSKWSGHSA